MCRRLLPLLVVLAVLGTVSAQEKQHCSVARPDRQRGFGLPNGWMLTPAGKCYVVLTDLPLNILPLRDSKHALVATSGYNKHELALIDLATQQIVDKQTVGESWFGLTLSPDQDRIWLAGGGANVLHTFALADGKLKATERIDFKQPPPRQRRRPPHGRVSAVACCSMTLTISSTLWTSTNRPCRF